MLPLATHCDLDGTLLVKPEEALTGGFVWERDAAGAIAVVVDDDVCVHVTLCESASNISRMTPLAFCMFETLLSAHSSPRMQACPQGAWVLLLLLASV